MYLDISMIFIAGIIFFSVAATYFLFTHKKPFNSAFLVSFITITSYIIMLEGSTATLGAGDEAVYATRWLIYGLSCTLLMYEIARFLGKSLTETVFLLYLTAIVMVTGAAAAYFSGGFMLSFFVISSIAYGLLLYPLLTSLSPNRQAITKYIVLGWTGFPVAFLLAPDGYGVITAATAALLYLSLDVFTKVVFYLDLYPKMAQMQAGDRS